MATTYTSACTIIEDSYIAGGYSNGIYAGYNVACLSFATPEFNGISKEVEFILHCSSTNGSGDGANLRYALCSSDANLSNYNETSDAVVDEYQITSGTLTIYVTSYGTTITLTVPTYQLKENTTYYLILWAYDYNGYGTGNLKSVNLIYTDDGFVYIDNGIEFLPYQCYIDNGTSWDLYVPYIDNGSSWDLYT